MAFNSISGTSNSTSVSKGIGGLVSGLETDELVTGMTSDIQNKIDQQLQEKQKIEWQQETYRALIKGVTEFNTKYFSSTSTKNITNASFFEAYVQNNLSETSKYVSLSGGLKNAGSILIDQITQLAEKAKYSNNVDVSQKLSGKLGDVTKLSGSSLTFYLDGVSKTITLDDIGNKSDLHQQLNTKLKEAFGTRSQYNKDQLAVYQDKSNQYNFMVTDGTQYYKVDEDGNYLNRDNQVVSSKDDAETIHVSDISDWQHVEKSAVQVKIDSNGLKFNLTDNSSTLALHSGSAASVLGAEYGVLRVDAGTSGEKLEIEIGAGLKALSGATLNFKVAGKSQSVTLEAINSLDDLAKQLNKGLTGVSAKVEDGKLVLDGKGNEISIESGKSNINILGKPSTGILSPLTVDGKSITTSINDLKLIDNLSGVELSFNVDGNTKTIRLGDVKNTKDLQDQLNTKLSNAFGKGTVSASVDDKGKITFTSNKEMTIRNYQTNVISSDTEGIIGINAGTSSKLNLNMSISDIAGFDNIKKSDQRSLTINGVDIEIGVHDTLNSIIQKVNLSDAGVTMSYSPMTGKVSLETTNTGSTEKIVIGKDGAASNLEKALFDVGGNATYTQGKNSKALITVDGQTMLMERPSNTITINGMDLTLKSTYNVDNTETAGLSFDVTSDVDKVVENIKGFIEDYNAVIKSVTDEINTRHDRKYPPLTDAQKEEMSDSQIEKWEAKAKEGLLYKDTALNNLVSQLRSALYQKVDGVSGFITDCGISTGNYNSNGQLVLDETKLKKVLNENPDMVVDLFTKQSDIDFIAKPTTSADVEDMAIRRKESGFMFRFQDILQQAIGTGTVKGTLLQNAGIENDRTESENTMTKKLDDIDDKVKALQKKLVSARERYWKQFTALEKYINQMNQQSASLLSQFGYSGS